MTDKKPSIANLTLEFRVHKQEFDDHQEKLEASEVNTQKALKTLTDTFEKYVTHDKFKPVMLIAYGLIAGLTSICVAVLISLATGWSPATADKATENAVKEIMKNYNVTLKK